MLQVTPKGAAARVGGRAMIKPRAPNIAKRARVYSRGELVNKIKIRFAETTCAPQIKHTIVKRTATAWQALQTVIAYLGDSPILLVIKDAHRINYVIRGGSQCYNQTTGQKYCKACTSVFAGGACQQIQEDVCGDEKCPPDQKWVRCSGPDPDDPCGCQPK